MYHATSNVYWYLYKPIRSRPISASSWRLSHSHSDTGKHAVPVRINEVALGIPAPIFQVTKNLGESWTLGWIIVPHGEWAFIACNGSLT